MDESYLKDLKANHTFGTFGFARNTKHTLRKSKRAKTPNAKGTDCYE